MVLPTLALVPESTTFSANVGDGVLSVKLDGGASRYRRNYIGSTYDVKCSWVLNKAQYEYMKAFYRTACNDGSTPFYLKMIFEDGELKPYKAYFKPKSLTTSGPDAGQVFNVSADFEVYPNQDAAINDDILIAFEGNFPTAEDELNDITNYQLPVSMV